MWSRFVWHWFWLFFFKLDYSGRLITNEIKKQESPQLRRSDSFFFSLLLITKINEDSKPVRRVDCCYLCHIPHPKLVSLVSVHVDFLHAAFKYVLPFFHGYLAIHGYTVIIVYNSRRHVTLCSVFLVFWHVKSPKFCML